jgi:hypothetical protein
MDHESLAEDNRIKFKILPCVGFQKFNRNGMAVISADRSAPRPPAFPACPSASPAHRSVNGARPTLPAPPSPSPALTPTPATTASSPSRVATLSPAACPFSPTGRSKAQRWASSCLTSPSSSALGVGAVGSGASQRTFKDVLLLPPPQPSARQSLPRPPHRPKFAVVQRPGTVRRPVPDREGWVRVEPRRRQLPPSPPPRRSIPEDLRVGVLTVWPPLIGRRIADVRCAASSVGGSDIVQFSARFVLRR